MVVGTGLTSLLSSIPWMKQGMINRQHSPFADSVGRVRKRHTCIISLLEFGELWEEKKKKECHIISTNVNSVPPGDEGSEM